MSDKDKGKSKGDKDDEVTKYLRQMLGDEAMDRITVTKASTKAPWSPYGSGGCVR